MNMYPTEFSLKMVPLVSLRERVTGFKLLFDCERPLILLSGFFEDRHGSRYELKEALMIKLPQLEYMPIRVREQVIHLRPCSGMIEAVVLLYNAERD
jgi:hypothetical protein